MNRRSEGTPNFWDRFFIVLPVSGLILLLTAQILLLTEGTRPYLSKIDRMEGRPAALSGSQQLPQWAIWRWPDRISRILTIKAIHPEQSRNALVLVNGRQTAGLQGGQWKVAVEDGDYIEIDATEITVPVSFLVTAAPEVVFPPSGLLAEGCHEVLTIGKVKIISR